MALRTVTAEVSERREQIRNQALRSLKDAFPFKGKRFTVDVEDVQVHPVSVSPEKHKKAILQARTLSEPVRGTLLLTDNSTGKVVQRVPNFNLLQLPYFTDHSTFVIGGTTYSVSNQLRMKPGVYTRKRKNEELEAGFNLSRGDNFRLSMDPEKGHFKVEYGTTKIPLYPVLNRLGVSDQEMTKHWNRDLVTLNRDAFADKADRYVDKMYEKLVPYYKRQSGEDKVAAIKQVLQDTRMDPEINQRTLGQPFDRVDPKTLLTASEKLLRAYQADVDFDERDSLAFKKLMTVDDFIGERIGLEARGVRRKVMDRIDTGKTDLQRAMPPSPFTKSIHKFLSTSQLSNNPDQINPVEMLDASARVTSLGEGGIENLRAIPEEARRLHTSHLGALDPNRTPETDKVGIDLRTTLFTKKDDNGNIYIPVFNPKKNKMESVSVTKLVDGTVAFPNQKLRGTVDVVRNNRVEAAPASQVDYVIPSPQSMYSPASNLVPFINNIDGNRKTMASKMQTQALPLDEAEPPLVQVASHIPGRSMEELIADIIIPKAPASGTVSSVRDGFININTGTKTAAEGVTVEKVPFHENFPLSSKTYLNDRLKVKPGDAVKKGQPLADATFVRDGQLALGKNLLTAYMPWRGLNSNDAIVVSEGAANKLTSLHMYKKGLDLERDMKGGRESHRTYYGNAYDSEMYNKLDTEGIAKPGQTVQKGDLLIAALRKSSLSPENAMLGKLHKSLVRPYRDASVVWDHDTPGEVTDVVRTGNKIRMTVKTKEPLRVGDKLAGRFGNKGVVSTIVPDAQMVKDEEGNTVDVVLTSAGVVSRVNPGQILETALGKVAKKTGKPIHVENYTDQDNVAWVQDQLKKHGIKDKETLFDPVTGKNIKNVFIGPQYTLKLFKSTETNYSARGVEDYDVNQQPSGGGPTGAKGLGSMEVNALLAHGARNILQEASTLKSQKNDEYWRAFQLGLPLPAPKTTFAFDRFGSMLAGTGVRVNKQGNSLRLTPLTDSEIMRMAPAPVATSNDPKQPLFVRAKDLRPEKGGLFDPVATGGTTGTKWSRIDLTEPIVNPIFERPVQALLGMTRTEFDDTLQREGGQGIKKRLAGIDVDAQLSETQDEVKRTSGAVRDKAIRKMKTLDALKHAEMSPSDAYVISKVPVVPPVYRPILPGKTGALQISDPNHLYRDVVIADRLLRKAKQELPEKEQAAARRHVYEATKALFGLADPVSPQAKARNVQGFVARIAGTGRSPKSGFFQSKLVKKRQDVSGRGTIVPDATLSLDEVGLPEDMAWEMYKPFLIRKMVQRGYSAVDARDKVDNKHPTAREFLFQEAKERPVLLNRAPSLRRYNVLAAYPKLVPGKSIRIHELFAPIQAGDFDGDTMQVHVPVTPKAVDEAKDLTLSKMLLGDQYKQQTMVVPQHESVLGVYRATSLTPKGPTRKFKNKADALAAYHRGEIGLDTPVQIGKNR